VVQGCSPNPYEEGTESTKNDHSNKCRNSCSPNPYEEGTERLSDLSLYLVYFAAAAQIPMKRELKDGKISWVISKFDAAAQIPMKRELKALSLLSKKSLIMCCSPNPYEEGTESQDMKIVYEHVNDSCSPNPYEEGTESFFFYRRNCHK